MSFIIVRCAWHRKNFGWPLLKGLYPPGWPPWPVRFSDGICDVCRARLHAGAGPAPLGRLVATVGAVCARIRTRR